MLQGRAPTNLLAFALVLLADLHIMLELAVHGILGTLCAVVVSAPRAALCRNGSLWCMFISAARLCFYILNKFN